MLDRVIGRPTPSGPTFCFSPPAAAADGCRGKVVAAVPMREGGRGGWSQPLHLRKADGEFHLAGPWTDTCLGAVAGSSRTLCTISSCLCAAAKGEITGFVAATGTIGMCHWR